MANIFVCHRKTDRIEAERLATELKAAGHDIWFDEWKIDIGDSIVQRINEGLEGARYLLLCCSGTGHSDWTDREWMSALARQLVGYSVKVVPVLLTGGAPPAILADIRYANLAGNWAVGIVDLLKALK